MSTLDQAFIKAYLHQGAVPEAEPLDGPMDPAVPLPPDEPLREEVVQGPIDDDLLANAGFPAEQTEWLPPQDAVDGPDDVPFAALLQVDRFAWPNACTKMSSVAGDSLDRLADGLQAEVDQGRKVLAMASPRRGAGCTTLLLCVARRLAQRGRSVVLVDADFSNPQLAPQLGVLPDVGWEEVLSGQCRLTEAAIESIADGMTLLPLRQPIHDDDTPRNGQDVASGLAVFRRRFDLALVDLGALGQEAGSGGPLSREVRRQIDAVVLVHNVRGTPPEELAAVQRSLEASGIVQAGVAENFVPAMD